MQSITDRLDDTPRWMLTRPPLQRKQHHITIFSALNRRLMIVPPAPPSGGHAEQPGKTGKEFSVPAA
jgi:hypothetical protein